jgi:hypothetical protein
MSAIFTDVGMAALNVQLAIHMSLQRDKASRPAIRVETTMNDLPYSSNDYPRGRVWQSAMWPEAIRELQYISVTIEPSSKSVSRDRLAMNHTLAGLVNYLDAASRVESLQIQLLVNRHFTTTELLDVIKPATILARCRPNVAIELVGVSEELIGASVQVQARRSYSRDDDTIEQLYSKVRMVINAAGRMYLAAMHTRLESLNLDRAEVMAELGFVGPGNRETVEVATLKVDGVLARLMEGL